MRTYDELSAALAEVRRLGIIPIAGGDGEVGTEGDTAGGEPGGDVSGESEQPQEQQDGQQDGVQGQQQPGQPQDGGQPVVGQQGGQQPGAQRGPVPYDRFAEVNTKASTLEQENKFWREQAMRQGGGQQQQQQGDWEAQVQSKFPDVHPVIGGYMKHMLAPFAQHAQSMQREIQDLRDQVSFYANASHQPYAENDKMKILEDTRQALERNTGHHWNRQDVLRYLRGHEEHGEAFAAPPTTEQRGRALQQETVTARRNAGNVGGRPTLPAQRNTNPDPLAGKSRADRVKLMESDEYSGKPF